MLLLVSGHAYFAVFDLSQYVNLNEFFECKITSKLYITSSSTLAELKNCTKDAIYLAIYSHLFRYFSYLQESYRSSLYCN